jgi:acyl-CoA synthetase (AMP-forming)/AMP-acid ligase II
LSVLSGETNLMKLNMGDALLRNAQRFPNKLALDDGRVKRTYLDLQSRTNRLGNYFLRQGICPGDRVALSCGNRAEHLEVIFALAGIGVTAVPFDPHWSRQESDAMLNFFAPRAFVIEKRHETADTADLVLDRLGAKSVLFIGGAFTPQATPYEEAISTASPENNGIDVDGNQPFIIMITSGTTGFPKGCIINHETYALRSLNNAISKGLNDKERGLLVLPLHFNAGRQSAMTLLYLGGTIFLQDKFDEESFVSTIERERITYTIIVPAIGERLLRYPRLDHFDKSTLSFVGISAGHLSPALAGAMMERVSPQIYEAYASTDCGQITIIKPEDRAEHGDSVGQPIWAVVLKIVDDHERELPLRQAGEIFVRTPMAIDGYYRNPEATKEFFSHGWCRTGDIGFLDDEGYLHVSGRKKSMIKSAGISIFPEEIEVVLRAHADVAEVAVVGCRHPEWGESVKALVIPKTGAIVEPEDIIEYCKRFMAHYKAPKVVEVVSSLPRTALGKIDRGKLELAELKTTGR